MRGNKIKGVEANAHSDGDAYRLRYAHRNIEAKIADLTVYLLKQYSFHPASTELMDMP